MCTIVGREGTASLVMIPALVWKISQENERGARNSPPPLGRGLTLARTGGGWCNPPPLRFFADSKKTAARSAAGFWATLWGKPCAIFGKKNLTGSGQVTEL